MRFLPLDFVHTEFQIDPLGTRHTLGLPNYINDPKTKERNENDLKNPIEIEFYAQKLSVKLFLASHKLSDFCLVPLLTLMSVSLFTL